MIIFVCIKQQCYSKGLFFNVAELSNTESYFVFTGAVIIIVFAVIRLLLEVLQFCYDLVNYLIDWVNWIEVILYAVSIVFAFVFRTSCFCPQKWQWQVGVVAILLGWINFIIICAKFPIIGIYVIMFSKIVVTFLKVIIISILLVITFGLTFYMTFSEARFQVSHILN